MKDFTSKLSLYDILTQLISGFLILALFIPDESLQENLIFVIIFSYLIGIIYHRFLELIRKLIAEKGCFSCCFCLGVIFQSNFGKALVKANGKSKNYKVYKGKDIKEKYYECYYSIMDKPAYGTIRTLEAQEAFLRNLTWVVMFYFIFFLKEKCCNMCDCFPIESSMAMEMINEIDICCMVIGFFLLFPFILFARYQTQMKVYKAVWEAGKYVQNSSKS